jgi:hypothetical protein
MRRVFVLLSLLLLAGCDRAAPPSTAQLDAPQAGRAPSPELVALAKKKTGLIRKHSHAVAEETEFDFGKMDPLTSGTHVFAVRNDGSAPLTLKAGDSSCKCTVGSVSQRAIAPGETGEVTLEWNTGNKVTYYQHWAVVYTNDPEHAQLTFMVKGVVRQEILFAPVDIDFGELSPDVILEGQTIVHSPTLEQFTIASVECSHETFDYEFEPAPADVRERLQAKQAYIIRARTPKYLPRGHFQETLHVRIKKRPEDEKAEPFEVVLHGSVLGRITIVGRDIDTGGDIIIGPLHYGRGATAKFKLRVRDEQRDLGVRKIEVHPAFLQVSLTPCGESGAESGLYDLTVEVPKYSKPCAFRGNDMATIRLVTNHPRISDINLGVDFSVNAPPDFP